MRNINFEHGLDHVAPLPDLHFSEIGPTPTVGQPLLEDEPETHGFSAEQTCH